MIFYGIFIVTLIYNVVKKNDYVANFITLCILLIVTLLFNIDELTATGMDFVGINLSIFLLYSFILFIIAIVLCIKNRKYKKYTYNLALMVLIYLLSAAMINASINSGGLVLEGEELKENNIGRYIGLLTLTGIETNLFYSIMIGRLKKYKTQEESGGEDYGKDNN